MRAQGFRTAMASTLVMAVTLGAATLGALALPGCVVSARPAYVGETVMVAPPPPQQEVISVAPGPGYFWIGGYWGWEGGRHVWLAGHWEPRRAGYYWVPHRWVPTRDGGWRLAAGHWARR